MNKIMIKLRKQDCLWPKHTGLISGVIFWGIISTDSRITFVDIPHILIVNPYVSLVIQLGLLPFRNNIQGGVLPKDNACPHKADVTQHDLKSIDNFLWPDRSPDLS